MNKLTDGQQFVIGLVIAAAYWAFMPPTNELTDLQLFGLIIAAMYWGYYVGSSEN